MGAFGGRGGLHVGQVRRDPGQRGILADGQVLRVSTAGSVVVPEHPITDGEATSRPGRAASTRPANSLPRILTRGRTKPGEDPDEERLSPRKPQSVRFTVVAWTLTSTSLSLAVGVGTSITRTHLRRAVASVQRSLHRCTVAAWTAGEVAGMLINSFDGQRVMASGGTREGAGRWPV